MKERIVGKRLVFVIILIILIVIIAKITLDNGTDASSASLNNNIIENQNMFPCEIQKGVVVESLFQFNGTNPDSGLEGNNIAGITIINTTEKHIKNAEVTIKIKDNETLRFYLYDLPSNKSIYVFEKDNRSYELTDNILSVKGKVSFDKKEDVLLEKISFDVSETELTISNFSDENIKNLTVHCHCALDDVYFGGLTYKYPVNELNAGETVQLIAMDCYMGEAAIVRLNTEK